MARWRSGLTHRPFKAAFTGSNPVRVTILDRGRPAKGATVRVATLDAYIRVGGSGSGVEHRLAKARVAGSNPVFRSSFHTGP
jgi:uncharacterized GH25 family protein